MIRTTKRTLFAIFLIATLLITGMFSGMNTSFAMEEGFGTQENLFNESTVQAISNTSNDESSDNFSWDNATVYFAMTDRFYDGDSSNNHAYGRELDTNGNPIPGYENKIGTFHGGDLKGLTKKLNEGYFTDLGVNAIWITQPFEQVHGWVGGKNFRHYAYHGYYTLDWTEIDGNMGTEEDLKTFIDTAHENGIRVVFDIVMNHTGYESMKDMEQYQFGQLNNGWYNYYYNSKETDAHYETYNNYISRNNAGSWQNWYGSDWIRAKNVAGYDNCGGDDKTLCVGDLPDLKTESTKIVDLPPILQTKWDNQKEAQEKAELDAFFNRTGKQRYVKNYMIKWITDWVREYGVDGFRIDTAKHVDMSVWKELKQESVDALKEWKDNNPDKALDDRDFWMTGEVWGHGVGKSEYFYNGFDSIINFTFQGQAGNLNNVEGIYSEYASKINSDDSFNMLSYISSHDKDLYSRGNLVNAGTTLLLLPGGVQIFYGDETARPRANDWPWDQPSRTHMNWDGINQNVLSHWQILGQFRNQHIAVGAGEHKKLQDSPYAFSRTYNKDGVEDKIVAALGANGTVTIDVSSVFSDGTPVQDFYTGEETTVSGGKVTFDAHEQGVVLIEQAGDSTPVASVSASPAGGAFYTDTLDITLKAKNVDNGYYTLNGSDPSTNGIAYVDGEKITIGSSMQYGDSVTLKLFAENEYGLSTQTYEYDKEERQPLTIHYKKPENWGHPQIYFYKTSPSIDEPTWDGAPKMISEGNDWYYYTIESDAVPFVEQARILFKDNKGNQTPGSGEEGFLRTQESWYDGETWSTSDPGSGGDDDVAPTVPADVQTVSVTNNSVELSWTASTDNVGVTGYDIYRDEEKIASISGTSYTDTDVSPATTYTYTVTAKDKAGNESNASTPLVVTTKDDDVDDVAPTVPTDLQTVSTTSNSVELSWTASTDNVGVTGYDIYRNELKIDSTTGTSYTDLDVSPATTYSYTVKAKDEAGNESNASIPLVVTTDDVKNNEVTVFYQRGFENPNIHYSPVGGTWTDVPGVPMDESSYAGFSKYTVSLGDYTQLEAVFNDGNGNWDNNYGQNYKFDVGVYTVMNGEILEGEPDVDQLTIEVKVPADTGNDDVYFASSLNGWDAGSNAYKLTEIADDTYVIILTEPSDSFEFKITRGSWETVEVDSDGNDIANRSYTWDGDSTVLEITVEKWRDK
ncbi:alpha-amylase family glycosyl hydrolase [Longirhabdus pacifica]|uniref:alpha-amylase family glycosyl hydrolase n=1 Tax=Longirhabdus pacifica TaxID=2305227 RepID=UPI0010091089|nr:alpha-amylase family glycosyl hydrolase [Longirhabdus pacifica]